MPILRTYHMHIGHQEILVQSFKGCGSAASSAGHDRCCKLSGDLLLFHGEEESVEKGCKPSIRTAIIHRRSNDHSVELVHTVSRLVYNISEYALSCFLTDNRQRNPASVSCPATGSRCPRPACAVRRLFPEERHPYSHACSGCR